MVQRASKVPGSAGQLEVEPKALAEKLWLELTARSDSNFPVSGVPLEVEPEVLDEQLAAVLQGVAIPVSDVHDAVALEVGPAEVALEALDVVVAAYVAPAQF